MDKKNYLAFSEMICPLILYFLVFQLTLDQVLSNMKKKHKKEKKILFLPLGQKSIKKEVWKCTCVHAYICV